MLTLLFFMLAAPLLIVALLIRNTDATPIAHVLYEAERSKS